MKMKYCTDAVNDLFQMFNIDLSKEIENKILNEIFLENLEDKNSSEYDYLKMILEHQIVDITNLTIFRFTKAYDVLKEFERLGYNVKYLQYLFKIYLDNKGITNASIRL